MRIQLFLSALCLLNPCLVFGTSVVAEAHIEVILIGPENIVAAANGVASAQAMMIKPEHYGAVFLVDGTLGFSPSAFPCSYPNSVVRTCESTLSLTQGGSTTVQCGASDSGQCTNSWWLRTSSSLNTASHLVAFDNATHLCTTIPAACAVPHRDQ